MSAFFAALSALLTPAARRGRAGTRFAVVLHRLVRFLTEPSPPCPGADHPKSPPAPCQIDLSWAGAAFRWIE
ncbi:hypothetical protein GCM10023108_03160 [Saccharopolyspora hordei]